MKTETPKELRAEAGLILSTWRRRAAAAPDRHGPTDDLWVAATWAQSVVDALAEGWHRAAADDMRRARQALQRGVEALQRQRGAT
jgi:hypothetical protein